MRTYFFIALICLCVPVSAAIYKWVDENGEVHYSDQEQTGSKEVKLPATVTYTPTASAGKDNRKVPNKVHGYREMSIVQPKMNETLHSNTGDVPVSIKLVPRLQSGDTITIYLDGNGLLKGKTQMAFTLRNVDRGSHTLRASVFDRNGASLISSQSVIFHLRKTIAETTGGDKSTDNSQAYQPGFNQDESKKANYKKDLSNDYKKDLSKDYDSSNSYKDEGKKFNNGIPSKSGTFNSGTGTYAPNYNQKK